MKFWELVSHCRDEPALLNRLADDPAWAAFLAWNQTFDQLVARQDRAKLDFELPDDACRHVLSNSGLRYEVSDGYVRTWHSRSAGEEISALEVFDRYGGSFLEDVNEYGLKEIPSG